MPEKLYTSRNIEYSVVRYKGCPKGKASFSFYCDTPVPNGAYASIQVGAVLPGNLWCPNIISPHPSIPSSLFMPYLVVTDLRSEDVVIGDLNGTPYRQYKFTAEGWLSDIENSDVVSSIISYTVNAEKKDDNIIIYSASIETISAKDNNNEITLLFNIGDDIQVPNVPIPLTCESYKANDGFDEFQREAWTIVYECSGVLPASTSDALPDEEEQDLSYELNGSTVRTIAGELLVLRRSQTPITKKTVIAYSNTEEPIYPPGTECHEGIALSENVVRETKSYKNITGVDIHGNDIFTVEKTQYYRHEIEVEL